MKRHVSTLILLAFLMLLSGCTIVYDSEDLEAEAIDPMTGRANGVWNEIVLPYIRDNAIRFDAAITENAKAAERVYFPIVDEITVVSTALESKSRTLSCETADGNTVTIQIGPIVKGTALRDGVDGINADDFTNQIEFAALSRELNKISISQVDENLDLSALVGRKIQIAGILQIQGDKILSLSSLMLVEE